MKERIIVVLGVIINVVAVVNNFFYEKPAEVYRILADFSPKNSKYV